MTPNEWVSFEGTKDLPLPDSCVVKTVNNDERLMFVVDIAGNGL